MLIHSNHFPLSSMDIVRLFHFLYADIDIVGLLSSRNFTALSSKLLMTCWICILSIETNPIFLSIFDLKVTFE